MDVVNVSFWESSVGECGKERGSAWHGAVLSYDQLETSKQFTHIGVGSQFWQPIVNSPTSKASRTQTSKHQKDKTRQNKTKNNHRFRFLFLFFGFAASILSSFCLANHAFSQLFLNFPCSSESPACSRILSASNKASNAPILF